MSTTLSKMIAVRKEELLDGIAYREHRVNKAPNETEKAKWQRMLDNWNEELYELENGVFLDHIELVEKPIIAETKSQRVDIIVLKWKLPEVETKCMEAIIQNTDWPHKVTWYDNRNQTANFSKMWNKLIKESTCDFVLIMDSDAFPSKGWLTKMMQSFEPDFQCRRSYKVQAMKKAAPVGLVVPITKPGGAHTIQGFDWNKDDTPFLTDAQVSGFCFLFRKSMVEDIGYFDERFYLHGQDSEWVDRVIDSPWNIVVRPDTFVDHAVSASIDLAKESGEIDYTTDVEYTKMVYTLIRDEKKRGVYEPKR